MRDIDIAVAIGKGIIDTGALAAGLVLTGPTGLFVGLGIDSLAIGLCVEHGDDEEAIVRTVGVIAGIGIGNVAKYADEIAELGDDVLGSVYKKKLDIDNDFKGFNLDGDFESLRYVETWENYMSLEDAARYKDWNVQKIRELSIHNSKSDTMTLGKFEPSINSDGTKNWSIVGEKSYNTVAQKNGDMYFDMKDGLYDATLDNYNLSYQNMFDDFNVPALDKAASEGKTIRFTHNPELKEYAGSFTDKEWKHLQEKWGYLYLREEGGFWYAEK